MLHPDVSLKLTLATATILTGYALRVTRVVTRENGESLLAVVFGILLPSLLIQVREEVPGIWVQILSARSRVGRDAKPRALFFFFFFVVVSRLCDPFFIFFARARRFFIGTNKRARTLTPRVFLFVLLHI